MLKQQFIKHINGKYQRNNIKNRTYYFFDYVININDFDSNLLKIDKNSQKNIDYITIKESDYVKIHSVNTSQQLINKVN